MISRSLAGTDNFSARIKYITNPLKSSHVRTLNIADQDNIAAEMELVSNSSSYSDRSCKHIVITLPSTENNVTNKQFDDFVIEHINALGYQDHQVCWAIHRDTKHHHAHVVINLVNLYTQKYFRPENEYSTMSLTCRKLEVEHGLSHDRGTYCCEYVDGNVFYVQAKDLQEFKKISSGAHKYEFYNQDTSFESHIEKDEYIYKLCHKDISWQSLHNQLRAIGIKIDKYENGAYTFTHIQSGHHASIFHMKDFGTSIFTKHSDSYQPDSHYTEQEVETILTELTLQKSWFSESDLDSYLTAFALDERVDQLKRAVMQSPACVHLAVQEPLERWQKPVLRFTSQAVWQQECRAEELAEKLSNKPCTKPNELAIRDAIESRSMRSDQLEAFKGVTQDRETQFLSTFTKVIDADTLAIIDNLDKPKSGKNAGRISVTVGDPGTGKSYVMNCINETYTNSGFRVVGASPTLVVSDAMKRDGFREATTVDSIIKLHELGKLDFDANTCLVIDEGGMIDNIKLLKILEIADHYNINKLDIFGDDKQLPAIGQGGLFTQLKNEYCTGTIDQIVRQKDEHQNKAARLFAKGMFEEGLQIFQEHGLTKENITDHDSREQILADFKTDYLRDNSKAMFIASFENADVNYFNEQVHNFMMLNSEFSKFCNEQTIQTGEGPFAFSENETIQFCKTDKKRGITNGMSGKIVKLSHNSVTVELRDKTTITFRTTGDNAFIDFRHTYAGTVHKSQGASIARTYLHHSHHFNANVALVALTRQTENCIIYTSKETANCLNEVARQMKKSTMKSTATSIGLSDTKHEVNKVERKINKSIADQISIIEDNRANSPIAQQSAEIKLDIMSIKTSSYNLRKELYTEYDQDVALIKKETAKASLAKSARINEIRDYQDKRIYDRRSVKHGCKADYDKATNEHIATIKERHKLIIDAMANKTKIPTFNEWLSQQESKKATEYKNRLEKQKHNKLYGFKDYHAAIDLNELINRYSNDFKLQLTDSYETATYKNGNQTLYIQSDTNGRGIRCIHEDGNNNMTTGGYKHLLKILDKEDQLEIVQKENVENKTKESIDQYVRQIDFTTLKKFWDIAKIANIEDRHKAFKIKYGDVRIATISEKQYELIGNRDKNNNVVSIDMRVAGIVIACSNSNRSASKADQLNEMLKAPNTTIDNIKLRQNLLDVALSKNQQMSEGDVSTAVNTYDYLSKCTAMIRVPEKVAMNMLKPNLLYYKNELKRLDNERRKNAKFAEPRRTTTSSSSRSY